MIVKKEPRYYYDLSTKLKMVEKVFSIDRPMSIAVDDNYIKKYYLINKIPYSIFHSVGNAVHMGVSRDGLYKEDDLYEQSRAIERYVKSTEAVRVLELGGGRGINSIYLAERNPKAQFTSLDFSESQTATARRLGKGLPNFRPVLGTFHNMKEFGDSTIDVAFAIETLCHSNDVKQVMAEVKRVLAPDGVFVVFDGYRGDQANLSSDEKIATILIEKGMAVPKFSDYLWFVNVANEAGLQLIEQENLSKFVLPTMHRFEALAGKFFRRPTWARLLSKILPTAFLYNAISGFLMPSLIDTGAAQYWMSVFRKR